jgi:2-octaprenyl-6-methoxyphenol hydroxylase
MKIETDIIVAGTGPAGLVTALALAEAGFSVVLAGPSAGASDRRTTALMKPSLDFLDRLGLLDAIRPQAAPLRAMRIVDATARLLRSPTVTFRAAEIGEEMFGMNIPNAHLNAVLADAVKDTAAIRPLPALVARWTPGDDAVEAALEDGTVVSAKLAAAADGRRSPAREAAGIEVKSWAAGQSALVLNFSHARPHHDISTEFHTEDGPFTQVPLPGLRSSLVWVTRHGRAGELAALADDALSTMIETRMQSMLGRVAVEPGGAGMRQVFPLASALPARFAARRIALIGEAAHVFPPIGAQGLNLGIRDAPTSSPAPRPSTCSTARCFRRCCRRRRRARRACRCSGSRRRCAPSSCARACAPAAASPACCRGDEAYGNRSAGTMPLTMK